MNEKGRGAEKEKPTDRPEKEQQTTHRNRYKKIKAIKHAYALTSCESKG
jgi:hypothetical protein